MSSGGEIQFHWRLLAKIKEKKDKVSVKSSEKLFFLRRKRVEYHEQQRNT